VILGWGVFKREWAELSGVWRGPWYSTREWWGPCQISRYPDRTLGSGPYEK